MGGGGLWLPPNPLPLQRNNRHSARTMDQKSTATGSWRGSRRKDRAEGRKAREEYTRVNTCLASRTWKENNLKILPVLKLGIIQARCRVEFGQEGDEGVCVVSGDSSSRGGEMYGVQATTRRVSFFHWMSRVACTRTKAQRVGCSVEGMRSE